MKSGNTFKFEKPGDVIAGVILEIKSSTKYGDDKLMVKVRSDVDHRVYAVFPPTMGLSQLRARGAMAGDHMAMRYMCLEKSEAGSQYKFMATLIERDSVLIEPGDKDSGESGNGKDDHVASDDIPF